MNSEQHNPEFLLKPGSQFTNSFPASQVSFSSSFQKEPESLRLPLGGRCQVPGELSADLSPPS